MYRPYETSRQITVVRFEQSPPDIHGRAAQNCQRVVLTRSDLLHPREVRLSGLYSDRSSGCYLRFLWNT